MLFLGFPDNTSHQGQDEGWGVGGGLGAVWAQRLLQGHTASGCCLGQLAQPSGLKLGDGYQTSILG